MDKTDKDELVPVWSVPTPVEAELVKNFLTSAGIKCAVEGANQAGFAAAIPIRIMVRAWDADRAKKMLEKERF